MSEFEHTQWLDGTAGEEAQKAYQYFMRPEPQEFLGPIQTEWDQLTGMEAMFRMASVGMVRNAKAEQRKDTKVYVGFNDERCLPHIRIDHAKPLQGWYQDKHNNNARSRPRPCFSEAILTEPYGGYCTVGCAFCYINSGFRGYRGSGLISVPVGYGAQVEKMLSKMRTSTAGYFSSFTDPFVPLENVYHNTQEAAWAFDRVGLPVFFLSRLSYPGWAIDLLQRNPYSYAQKSLNTGNDQVYGKLSPGALSLSEHIEEVAALRRLGIYTSIQVNPVLPGVIPHEDIRTLFERLAEVGNNHVIVKFVEAGYSWAPAMVERLRKRFPAGPVAEFERLFTENQAGSQRTVAWEYRREAHEMYQRWATELGMTYATCYEYAKMMGKWQSVGWLYTTANQCHGQRVPMFTRAELWDTFHEVKDCPPTGCLYCADDNGGEPRCGNETFGAASALRAPQFKIPVRVEKP